MRGKLLEILIIAINIVLSPVTALADWFRLNRQVNILIRIFRYQLSDQSQDRVLALAKELAALDNPSRECGKGKR